MENEIENKSGTIHKLTDFLIKKKKIIISFFIIIIFLQQELYILIFTKKNKTKKFLKNILKQVSFYHQKKNKNQKKFI